MTGETFPTDQAPVSVYDECQVFPDQLDSLKEGAQLELVGMVSGKATMITILAIHRTFLAEQRPDRYHLLTAEQLKPAEGWITFYVTHDTPDGPEYEYEHWKLEDVGLGPTTLANGVQLWSEEPIWYIRWPTPHETRS